MADLAAKDGSQETVVNLVALVVNLAILPWVTGQAQLTGGLFLLLTALHLYANWRAVSCLVLPTLNVARLALVLGVLRVEGRVVGVAEGNRREEVLWRTGGGQVRLGVSLGEVQGQEVELLEQENGYVVLGEGRVLLSDSLPARGVYRAYVAAVMGEEGVEEVLHRLEGGGWTLGTLALSTEGFTYHRSK